VFLERRESIVQTQMRICKKISASRRNSNYATALNYTENPCLFTTLGFNSTMDLNPSRHTMLCVVGHNWAGGMANSRLALASGDEYDWLDLNNLVQ
jgi:hypothetical protein